ncbi:DUF5684 domain-containing protein [Microbacterium sp. SORGH_AS_0888]|uniref:DUF5684 domain-containing protein n=1 Tax=Microbacterium sp. SORGH_AS_0888 TaxID=3041791 RepID=UPI002780F225|nr:DUF5684 domain-containing protein [Microbacterium sp. SORGH_AS_0888]MDQ1129376.1 hypothetical protein [Microbacterium sp. SORGH_AS_0888]
MQTALLHAATSPLIPGGRTVVIVLLVAIVPGLLVYVWTALALSRVYAKLGIAGWKAWVPVYNAVVFLGLGGFSGWLLLLLLIPLFGAVFVYVAIVTSAHRVNAVFGHGAGMTVLAALVFPVWASVLGFGGADPAPDGDAYDRGHDRLRDEDAAAALRALSPDFGRPALNEPLFDARREVLPPSAWIPAAPEPERAAAPVLAPETWAPRAEPPAAAPAHVAEPPTVAVPVRSEAPAAPPAPEPAPVTSWWMPAPDERAAAAPSARVAPEPAAAVPPPPAAPAPPVAPVAAPPVLREAYLPEADAFPEESGAVSAVAGSPTAGAPRAAASAVSAFRPGVGDIADDTFIAQRKRALWALELPDGTAVDLTEETVVLGRRPSPVPAAPGAQLITIEEETRTISKTHALLRRQGETWTISDLGSTNGVMVDTVEVEPGQSVVLDGDFLLGDATLRLARRR